PAHQQRGGRPYQRQAREVRAPDHAPGARGRQLPRPPGRAQLSGPLAWRGLRIGRGFDTTLAMRTRVLVAMSGGVDSAVAAARLVDAGHEVVGVTLHLWDY